MKRFLLALGAIALTGALFTTAASANTTCKSTISGGTITGGLTVPAGKTCILKDVIVTGGIKINGGDLEAELGCSGSLGLSDSYYACSFAFITLLARYTQLRRAETVLAVVY